MPEKKPEKYAPSNGLEADVYRSVFEYYTYAFLFTQFDMEYFSPETRLEQDLAFGQYDREQLLIDLETTFGFNPKKGMKISLHQSEMFFSMLRIRKMQRNNLTLNINL